LDPSLPIQHGLKTRGASATTATVATPTASTTTAAKQRRGGGRGRDALLARCSSSSSFFITRGVIIGLTNSALLSTQANHSNGFYFERGAQGSEKLLLTVVVRSKSAETTRETTPNWSQLVPCSVRACAADRAKRIQHRNGKKCQTM
jgi:hypothetical protein